MCYMREFRIFVAAYEKMSFSAAARREHVTQSAVSQHIKRLEDVVGVKLFVRDSKSVQATRAGHAYYHHCIELLDAHDRALAEIRGFQGIDGVVSVGVMPWMARSIVPAVLDQFVQEHPNVALDIVESSPDMLTRQVEDNAISFAVVPAQPGTTRDAVVANSSAVLLSAADLGKAPGRNVPPVARLIVPPRSNPFREFVDEYLALNGIVPQEKLEINSELATMALVQRSDWQSVVPSIVFASEARPEAFLAQPLGGPPRFRLQMITAKKPASTATSYFRHVLEAEISRVSINSVIMYSDAA